MWRRVPGPPARLPETFVRSTKQHSGTLSIINALAVDWFLSLVPGRWEGAFLSAPIKMPAYVYFPRRVVA